MMYSSLLQGCKGIIHAFTDRHGGKSPAPYRSRNLAYHVGDDPRSVDLNHDRLAKELGYTRDRLVHMRQVHSDKVIVCTPDMNFDSRLECDALITDTPGQPLMVMAADCTPVLLHDPRQNLIAAIHAGRAGALGAIVTRTITTLQSAYGSDPEDLYAVLGPSIRACCYEVGETVAREVEAAGYALSLSQREAAWYLDVNAMLLTQLRRAGIREDRTEALPHCTACQVGNYFSYRAEKKRTGRQAGLIMLND